MELKTKKKLPIIPIIVAALVLIIVVSVIIVAAGSGKRKVSKQLSLGTKYLNELNYSDAIVAFENVLKIDPRNEEAYLQIIAAYEAQGDYESALDYAKLGYKNTHSDAIERKVAEIETILNKGVGTVGNTGIGSSEEPVWNDEYVITDVPINEVTFPDSEFRKYVKETLDTDKDGIMSKAEIEKTDLIDVSELEIHDMTGIEYFVKLSVLNCSDNQITSLDVSMCRELVSLVCDFNQLTQINVKNCLRLGTLSCVSNQLTNLDVSGYPDLMTLNCNMNQLTSLGVTNCPNLQTLMCMGNYQLSYVDATGCTSLMNIQTDGEVINR